MPFSPRRRFEASCPALSPIAIAALLALSAPTVHANTEKDVLPTATTLDNGASYQGGGIPAPSNDLTFTAAAYANTAFTINAASLAVGTLNNLNSFQALTISASRRLTLNGGSNSVAGSATGDLLYLAAGANLTYSGTGGIELRTAGNFNIADSARATINTFIDGSFAITKTGAGTLTLTGANTTYKGDTTFAAGTLNVGSAAALGDVGKLIFTGGTLQYSAANTTDYSARFSTAANQFYSVDTNGQNVSFATGLASSGGTLTKLGEGTLTLNGTGTYTVATTVNAGTLVLNDGAHSGVTVNNAANLQVQANTTVRGATSTFGGGGTGVVSNGTGTVVNAGTMAGGAGATVVFGGLGSNGGNGGAGVSWSNPATFTNTGTVNGGNGAYGSNMSGRGGFGASFGDGSLVNTGTVTGGAGGSDSLNFNGPGGVGVSFGSNGSLTNNGTIKGGNGGNGAFGGNGGDGVSLVGGATLTNAATISGGSGGRGATIGGSNPFDGIAGSGVTSSGTAITLVNLRGGTIANGVVLDSWANNVTLQAGSSISGGLYMGTSTAASLTLTDDGTGGSQAYSGAVSGGTSFSGTLVKRGAGTWVIDQALAPSATTLAAGVLQLGGGGALGTGAISFTGGTLQYSAANTTDYSGRFSSAAGQAFSVDTNGQNVSFANGLSSSGGSFTKLGAGTLMLTGDSTYTGNTTVSAGTLVLNGGSTASRLLRASTGAEIDYTGGVSVGGNLGNGGGTQRVLSGGATFSSPSGGVLTLFNGVSLSVEGPTAFNQVNSSGAITVASARTLTWNDGKNDQGTLTVNGTANTSGFTSSGVIAINNGGTLTNAGSNLLLGGGSRTTINSGGTLATASGTSIELNGSLLVNNGRQSGVLDINFGSLAKGSGSFGTINIADGGKFSPGNSPGTATAENFTFGAGGRYDFELNTANPRFGIDSDLLVVTDTLFLTAGTTPNSVFTIGVVSLNQANQPAALTDFYSSRAYHYLLVDASTVSGFASAKFNVDTSGFFNSLNGGRFSVNLNGSDVYLDFMPMPVPEPATWAMWLAAAAVGAGLQARRRK